MAVSLDMSKMNRILWIDRCNMIAEIEGGAVGADIEAALRAGGLTLGHEPDSSEFSTLGGWIATRASGMKKNSYGNIEDIVCNVRFVVARPPAAAPSSKVAEEGRENRQAGMSNGSSLAATFTSVDTAENSDLSSVLTLGSNAPRQSLGPNVLNFALGSEGTLGVICSATVRIRELPEVSEYGSIAFPTFENGVAFMQSLAQERIFPASIRLVDNLQFQFAQALKADVVNTRGLSFFATVTAHPSKEDS